MPTAVCKNCDKEFKFGYSSTGTYCSLKCSKESQAKIHQLRFEEGLVTSRPYLKNRLVKEHGWKCMCCGNEEWMGSTIPLELDHIDGNAGNNRPENLRLLCPNCHAQTPTHKARNKGNGRGSRGLPWY